MSWVKVNLDFSSMFSTLEEAPAFVMRFDALMKVKVYSLSLRAMVIALGIICVILAVGLVGSQTKIRLLQFWQRLLARLLPCKQISGSTYDYNNCCNYPGFWRQRKHKNDAAEETEQRNQGVKGDFEL
jgi:hypothetical protein